MYSETRYRLVVLGSARVGKTALIRQYLYKNFSDKYRETVEDLHCSQFRIRGITLTLDILDTSVNYPDMRRLAIRTASAFLLVFAVDDVHSFKQMSDLWTEVCDRRFDISQVPIVIAGNKSDILLKKIFFETAHSWVSRLQGKVRYLEVSAKANTNVTDIFRNLLELSGFPFNVDNETSETDAQEVRVPSAMRRHHSMGARHVAVPKTAKSASDSQNICKESSLLYRVLSLSPRNRRRTADNCERELALDRMVVLKQQSKFNASMRKRNRLPTWSGSQSDDLCNAQPLSNRRKTTDCKPSTRTDENLHSADLPSQKKQEFRQRTKHMSLKMHRRCGDANFDESNCKIS